MKKLALTLTLLLFTSQAHAFGWFLLGMALGESNSNTTIKAQSQSSNRFLDVYQESCYATDKKRGEYRRRALINSATIKTMEEPRSGYGDINKCTNVYTHGDVYHINASYNEVMKKLFKGQK